MKKDYTIAVAGTGYVGLSIATLLSQHHKVMAVDIVKEKVDLINNRKSPIQDNYIEKYLAEKELNLTATLDSDEENKNLEKKFAVLSEQVKIKSEQLEKSEEPNDSNVTKKFKDRLTRYYKFFEYRKQKLAAMRQPENKSTKAYKEELKEIIYGKELLKGNNDENSLSSVLAIAYLSAMQYYFKPIQELPTGRGEEALQTSYFFLSQSIGTIILHLSLN